MSFQITEAFVQQFADNFKHVAQQNQSRLERCVTIESGIVGMSKTVNRLGKRNAQRRLVRHGDTPINDQPHSTRYVDLEDWEDGDMIDQLDKVRLLVDPTSDYVKAMVAAMGRAKDDVIIGAMGGGSRSTQGNILLPASQKIALNATGLTKAKIIQAKKLFRQNEADEENGEELFFAYTAQMMADVLGDPNITTADQTTVQMIQNGTMKGQWMGFTWVPSERLPRAAGTAFGYAWAKTGVALGIGEDTTTEVGKDPGKGFNVRVYAKQAIGSVRVEEEKVVEIACADA
ncbi:phage capsid protein [Stenotrophomonas maltophilia]|uniref:phage capsid protein n=1 Tax=Stenotrophomonas maltophilia TaxID=40324 RepID=UPI0039C13960